MSINAKNKLAASRTAWIERLTSIYDDVLQVCESPIEKLLLAAFLSSGDYSLDEYSGSSAGDGEWVAQGPGGRLALQRQIGKYRADFALRMGDAAVVVECDGHDFHEKTKEQAARDKRRDRELSAGGWVVLRFSGSEVWRDPDGCARQATSALSKIYMQRLCSRDPEDA